mmetsp:Transcript_56390/g.99035  ORF Transcript_56390/g.99035 Transcript_56390/m.99035 type:complete len:236 (-) Transcript_56390:2225-2932(-)
MIAILARRGFGKHRSFWCGGLVGSTAERGHGCGSVGGGIRRRVRDVLLVMTVPRRVGFLPVRVAKHRCVIICIMGLVVRLVSIHITAKTRRTITHMVSMPSTSSTRNTRNTCIGAFGRNNINSFTAENIIDVFGFVGQDTRAGEDGERSVIERVNAVGAGRQHKTLHVSTVLLFCSGGLRHRHLRRQLFRTLLRLVILHQIHRSLEMCVFLILLLRVVKTSQQPAHAKQQHAIFL